MSKIDEFTKEIEKKYGVGCIISGDAVKEKKVGVISVSPESDIALGGGIQEGSTVILTGPPKCGKTVTALTMAANAQKNGSFVIFLDAEGRLKPRDLEGINGLKTDKDSFRLISSYYDTKKEVMVLFSAEDLLQMAEDAIIQIPNAVLIVDSVSSLCSKQERDSGMDKMQRTDVQKMLAKFCRKIALVLPVNKSILILITHIMANPSGYGAAIKEKGGFAIAFQVDTKIHAKKVTKWENQDKKQIGQSIDWVVEVSALGPPGSRYTSWLRYGHGLDSVVELTKLGMALGLISGGGTAWLTCDFMQNHLSIVEEESWNKASITKCKFNGVNKLEERFRENEDWYKALSSEIRKIFNVSY